MFGHPGIRRHEPEGSISMLKVMKLKRVEKYLSKYERDGMTQVFNLTWNGGGKIRHLVKFLSRTGTVDF